MAENKLSILQRTRNNFLTGLVLVAPVTLTGYLVWGAIKFFDEKVTTATCGKVRQDWYEECMKRASGELTYRVATEEDLA